MCFSTARFVRTSDVAIAAFDDPRAISDSTSRSRRVSSASRESRRESAAWISSGTSFASITTPPCATTRIVRSSSAASCTRSFTR